IPPLPPGFADMLPGPELVVAFAAVDRDACNGFELGVLLQAARKVACWGESLSLAVTAVLAHCPPCFKDDEAERSSVPEPRAAELLSPMLGWTNYRSDQFMLIALALTDLPNTRQALERGELEFSEVRTIVDRLTLLPPADRTAVDEAIFPEVLKLRAGLLRLHIEAEILKVNPEAAKERHKRAREDRGVDVYPSLDGVCDLRIRGIAHDVAAQIWGYLDAIARTMKSSGDERTLPQLRADIAASLLSGQADVIICDGEEEAREGADSHEQTSADAESASEDCDCENGDGENGEDPALVEGPLRTCSMSRTRSTTLPKPRTRRMTLPPSRAGAGTPGAATTCTSRVARVRTASPPPTPTPSTSPAASPATTGRQSCW
uniref:DUF222 domain-containing protein n=1 Tax=Actinopolymorpha alba TaxID=533267 RepID=UPI001ED9C045